MSAPDLDLSRAFDDLFAGEHEGPPVAHHVARGRRYVLRRRATAALAAGGVAVIIGSGLAVGLPGPEATDGAPPASGPTTPEPTIRTKYDFPEDAQDLARIDGYTTTYQGDLIVGEGVEVLDRVDLPPGAGHADRSYGLHIVHNGKELWIYAPWTPQSDGLPETIGGPTGRSVAPVEGTTFREWLDGVVAAQRPPEPVDPDIVTRWEQQAIASRALDVDRHGRVTVNPGAEILERIDNPMGLAPPYESTALRVTYRGVESYWLAMPGGTYPTLARGERTFGRWLQRQLASQRRSFSGTGPTPPLARINPRGMPELLPGVEVVRRVDDPLGVDAPARSVAYWARLRDGSEWWYLWEVGPSGYNSGQVVRAAGDGYPSFDAWLADQRPGARW